MFCKTFFYICVLSACKDNILIRHSKVMIHFFTFHFHFRQHASLFL